MTYSRTNTLKNIKTCKGPLALLLVALMLGACSSETEEPVSVEQSVTPIETIAPETAATDSPIPVIFDTDMAIDDWSTLLFLERHEAVDLLAVTLAGSGESHCEPGTKNIISLLELANPESTASSSCGDSWAMDGYFVFPVPWQEDMDILSGVPVPEPIRAVDPRHSVEIIHELVNTAEQPPIILATGPLTNIAQWLLKYPEDMGLIDKLVIMGGSVEAPGNIIVPGFTDGHPNEHAEWNLFVDPLAAKIVFESPLEITMVGLDVTNQVKVTAEFAERFKAEVDNPAAEFWDAVLDKNDWFIASGEYYFWDVLAAIVLVHPDYCVGTQTAIDIGYEATDDPWMPSSDMTIPDTRWDGQPRQHLNPANAGVTRFAEVTETRPANTLVCLETKADEAFDLFVETLTDG